MRDYCCRWMQGDLEGVCEQHPDRFECPDALIHRAADGTYGVIVHDGGSSFVTILVCPWCGTELHDGSIQASLDGSAESNGVEFDFAAALTVASDDALSAAARAQWTGDAVRALLDLAGGRTSVGAELAKLRETEASGAADADWWVDQ